MSIFRESYACDCESRVLWLGEDEQGNVVAVGCDRFITISIATQSCDFHVNHSDFLHAFTSNRLITITPVRGGARLALPGGKTAFVPIMPGDVYDSCYVRAVGRLFILSLDKVVCVEVFTGEVRVVADGLREDENYGRYESLLADSDCVAAYQYGLNVWSHAGKCTSYNDRPYSHVTRIPSGEILAFDEFGKVVHVITLADGIVDQFEVPYARVHYFGAVAKTPVFLWRDDGNRYVSFIREGYVHNIAIGQYDVESYCPIYEMNLLAVGTTQGEILLVHLGDGGVTRIHVSGQPRIVQLFWSERLKRLFVGTGQGHVYIFKRD